MFAFNVMAQILNIDVEIAKAIENLVLDIIVDNVGLESDVSKSIYVEFVEDIIQGILFLLLFVSFPYIYTLINVKIGEGHDNSLVN